MGRSEIVIFDPEQKPTETPESKIRPVEHGVIQLQMIDMYCYEMYWAPNEMEEFGDIDSFTTRLTFMVRKYLVQQHGIKRPADLEYETTTLVDRGLSLMTNYHIANIDLRNKTAYEMVTARLRHTPPKNGRVIY